ncbi:MAG: helix-turn-helix domain-containing protein [Bacteroidota bacterium]
MAFHSTIQRPAPLLKEIIHHYEFHVIGASADQQDSYTFLPNLSNGFIISFFEGSPSTISGGNFKHDELLPQTCFSPNWVPLTNRNVKHVRVFKVFFQPGILFDLYQIPISHYIYQQVEIGQELDVDLRYLYEQFLENVSPSSCIQLLESYLIRRLSYINLQKDFQDELATLFVDSGFKISIKQAAQHLGYTTKTLSRKLHRRLGGSTRDFVRTLRFNHGLKVLQENHCVSLTALSYELGFYDQSHFSREFKAMSGISPKEYVKTIKGKNKVMTFEEEETFPRVLRGKER